MLVYEVINKCGNWIDEYRILKDQEICAEFISPTSLPDRYSMCNVVRFQIEKIDHNVLMEVVI